ncbi:phosphoribosylformimino-5-aminoimidazole carboxamide ribotide isomerase [Metabacillus halosaccharovorans]|uniref:phosphoribosylformimino-5-aminoimidazole carboxamide ribotide isomerase n=1 Tax=Metabacillus halosaccharovorans TaxID=930124 RepID=UPI001C1F865A|nr:phosphoribosylformimino-5-aminoimidazole carboxamide ribotide isomerase [Metabacillus halosaccharovorans]MBU7595687.1 phosphoribosylformimino-5-aminoimidazole carboxamide ribotide isomerase [Metabacillus halosaccharovorans]
MNFRPCIDIHEGKVKQIVGDTLNENNQNVVENFVSEYDSVHYASIFKNDGLKGGHVIMLGDGNSNAAIQALKEYPHGLQIGGGITSENASFYLENGASHVIVTSFIFENGQFNLDRLNSIIQEIGKDKLVIDLSCKDKNGKWFVVTNKWTKFSNFEINESTIKEIENYCDEFLIHAVDVEGKRTGIQETLVQHLSKWVSIPTTYAGGVRSIKDLETFYHLSDGKLDITIGSSLDLFGGELLYNEVVEFCKNR